MATITGRSPSRAVNNFYLDTIRQWPLTSGNEFTDNDITSEAKVCLLGQTVVTNLFTNGESPVGKYIRFAQIPFLVIGVLSPKGANAFGQDQDDIIIAPYTTVQKKNFIHHLFPKHICIRAG